MSASPQSPHWSPRAAVARAQLRRFARRNPTIVAGGIILGVIALLAILAPLFAGDADHDASGAAAAPALRRSTGSAPTISAATCSRARSTARASRCSSAFRVATLSIAVGLFIGLMAGYFRKVDAVVMRLMDGLMAIPAILLAIALVALTRASVSTVIVAITIPEMPRVVRLVRAVVLGVREAPYVEAAIAGGTPTWKILLRHILPSTIAPLIVQATYICASAILIEAALSFLGAGTPPEIPTWGNMIAQSRPVPRARALDHLRARHRARARRARREPARRRPARPARPAACEADVKPTPARRPRYLQTHFFTDRRRHARGRRRVVRRIPRRDARHRRRIRLRQERHGALDHAAAAADGSRRTVGGSVTFEGRDLVALDEAEMRALRGNRIAMIFQEPMTSLNPVLTVGHQIAEIGAHPYRRERQRARASAPPRCCGWSTSPTPSAGSTTTRISSPAACASA